MLISGAIRLSLCGLTAAIATCSAPQGNTTPTLPAEVPAEAPTELAFDPDVVRPDADSAVGRVRAALDLGDPERAAAIAATALAHAEGDDLHRLWWLSARATQEAGTPARSFATLANVSESDHALAPWAQLLRAEILMGADAEGAVAEVAPLTRMDWAGRGQARDLHAAALVSAGDGDAAEAALRALLDDAPEGSARASVALPLAELLAARDEVDAKVEAIGLLRRVSTRAPLSSAGRAAEVRALSIIAELPRARRRALAEPPPEDAFHRAAALASAMRFREAEQAFAEVVARTRDDELECRARMGQGRAIYYRRQRRRAAEHLARVARECEAPEVRAWAYYLAGKGFHSAREDDLALAQYARLEAQVPEHSLADDARYRAALIDFDRGDEDGAVARLTSLPTDYPRGDMRGRARFMLAWRARRNGDPEEALRQLEASAREGIGEDREDLAGRGDYWRGRVLAEMDRDDEAIDAWTTVVRDAPLSYYAQQALARLEEADEASATAARALLGERGDDAIRFAWRDELDSESFARALELLRVGEVERANRELTWLEDHATENVDELRWIHAALLDRVGDHPRAIYLTRRRLGEFMRQPPAGAHFARWRIAYPRAYANAILAATEESPVPPELVFAIAREESSFRPDAVSVAHAYGLTQLLVPTARRFGRRLDLRVTATTLQDPVVNLRIGAAYMGWLWQRYEDNPVVLPSAYNAGQGATDRWLRERPDQRLDEWIEDIPYDETRRYTRRVLQTWGIYTWLDRGELPELGATLPRR